MRGFETRLSLSDRFSTSFLSNLQRLESLKCSSSFFVGGLDTLILSRERFSRAEELERENSALRHQLASFSNPNDGAQDCRYKLDQRSVASDASGAHHKRRATSPASRFSPRQTSSKRFAHFSVYQLYREYEVTPRLAPQNLPAGPQQRRPAPPPPPTRLSLSPAHNAKVVTKLQTSRQNHLIAESASNRAASSRAEFVSFFH